MSPASPSASSSARTPPPTKDDPVAVAGADVDAGAAVLITVVHCWSSPRSRSTALMYSFESRGPSSCVAIDEPLYRRWLLERGDDDDDWVVRPYRRELIQGVPPEGGKGGGGGGNDDENEDEERRRLRWSRERRNLSERIADGASDLLRSGGGGGGGVIFCKHMAKHAHLYDFRSDRELPLSPTFSSSSASSSASAAASEEEAAMGRYVLRHVHVLLVRDPVAVLSSWGASADVHGNNPSPDEVGVVPLLGIHSSLVSRPSLSPFAAVVVLDSDALADDPRGTLSDLCLDLGIPYTDDMLTWKSGPHECDGPWADWWYADVHKSTGWFGHAMKIPDPLSASSSSASVSDYPQTYVPPAVRKYRTLDPRSIDTLRASMPAYQYLRGLTRQQRRRGPPSLELYEDPRNENLLVWIGPPGRGRLIPRDMAGVSPWDSSVQGGDACWEGLRVYRGKILSLDKHLDRLFKSAKALGFYVDSAPSAPACVHTREEVTEAIFRTLAANGMRDGAHMRLTLTRGEKCTSSMNPKFNVYGTTLIILPEWKPTEGATTYDNTKGISLITASTRRNPPSTLDSKIHHNNMINNILPKIQANLAGAADAIMLDVDGYVSETNATNLFMVDEYGTLVTPAADHCLPGITRRTVLTLANELGIRTEEVHRVSLAEFHSAEEVFTTGTMGELTPVTCIDGRTIGTGRKGIVTARLQEAYRTLPDREGWATALPPFS